MVESLHEEGKAAIDASNPGEVAILNGGFRFEYVRNSLRDCFFFCGFFVRPFTCVPMPIKETSSHTRHTNTDTDTDTNNNTPRHQHNRGLPSAGLSLSMWTP